LSDLPQAMADDAMTDDAMARSLFGNTPDSVGASAEQLNAQTPLPFLDEESRAPVDEAAKALALAVAEAADDRKAGNITILQTGDISYLADYFVIVTGFSNVQVRAIANSIEGAVQAQFDRLPLRTEGAREGRWVLQDYGDVIVHIFMPDDREFYDLEAFWGHAERIEFIPSPSPASLSVSPLK
jgi:ribosome-associated protein